MKRHKEDEDRENSNLSLRFKQMFVEQEGRELKLTYNWFEQIINKSEVKKNIL